MRWHSGRGRPGGRRPEVAARLVAEAIVGLGRLRVGPRSQAQRQDLAVRGTVVARRRGPRSGSFRLALPLRLNSGGRRGAVARHGVTCRSLAAGDAASPGALTRHRASSVGTRLAVSWPERLPSALRSGALCTRRSPLSPAWPCSAPAGVPGTGESFSLDEPQLAAVRFCGLCLSVSRPRALCAAWARGFLLRRLQSFQFTLRSGTRFE